MKTITFYSYKGGVGRSLALANTAKKLAESKKKVCVIDFDLEAPGLHHKFKEQLGTTKIVNGIVDYIYSFSVNKKVPESITEFVTKIKFGNEKQTIDFIAAGNTFSSDYWKKLSYINWNSLFYESDSEGLYLFLDLKEKIRKQLEPDVLLIDSRTGISEVSGIALSLLADEVVVMAANNDENLEGAGHIIKSIKSDNNVYELSPTIFFVLTRIPYPNNNADQLREDKIVINALETINKILSSSGTQFRLDKINAIIHSDRELEHSEFLPMAYKNPFVNNRFSDIEIQHLTQKEVGIKTIPTTKANIHQLIVDLPEKLLGNQDVINFQNELFSTNNEKTLPIEEDYYNLFEKIIPSDLLSDGEKQELNKNKLSDVSIFKSSLEKDIKKKILILENSLKSNPNYSNIYYTLYLAYMESGEKKKSLPLVKKLIDLQPKDSRPYVFLSREFFSRKKYKEAIKEITKAISLDSNNALIFKARATIYFHIGEYNKALKDISIAMNLVPNDPNDNINKAKIYMQMKKYKDAFKNYSRAIEIDPKNILYLKQNASAIIFVASKFKSKYYEYLNKAILIYDKILDIEKTDITSLKFLAMLNTQLGLAKSNPVYFHNSIKYATYAINISPLDPINYLSSSFASLCLYVVNEELEQLKIFERKITKSATVYKAFIKKHPEKRKDTYYLIQAIKEMLPKNFLFPKIFR